jgi:hypothetical protein
MRKPFHLLLAVVLGLSLSGCFPHTVIGDGMGKPSPDGRLTLAVSSHGASRKAYVDFSKKRVYVWVMTNVKEKPETLLNREYVLNGADLEWRTRWQSSQEVIVDFYDFGDKVSQYEAEKMGAPSNHVATISFVLDAASGKWSEKK